MLFCRKLHEFELFFNKIAHFICRFTKKQYLCIAFEKQTCFANTKSFRVHSSAGSEHLPYKQRVIGSNPIGPTEFY